MESKTLVLVALLVVVVVWMFDGIVAWFVFLLACSAIIVLAGIIRALTKDVEDEDDYIN